MRPKLYLHDGRPTQPARPVVTAGDELQSITTTPVFRVGKRLDDATANDIKADMCLAMPVCLDDRRDA